MKMFVVVCFDGLGIVEVGPKYKDRLIADCAAARMNASFEGVKFEVMEVA